MFACISPTAMSPNSIPAQHFSAYYNIPLLRWRRDRLGFTNRRIAEHTPANKDSVCAVFRGAASYKTVFIVSEFLGLDWAMVHRLTLSEQDYPLAVLSGPHLIAPEQVVSNSG